MADDLPEMKKMLEDLMAEMYGSGGKLVTHIVPADQNTIVTGLTSTDVVLQAIRTIKLGQKGLLGDPQVTKTAALLPADAPWVIYWSPKGTVAFAKRFVAMFSSLAPAPAAAPKIPDFPDTPAIGIVVGKAPNELQVDAVVPSDTLKAVAAYILKIWQMANDS